MLATSVRTQNVQVEDDILLGVILLERQSVPLILWAEPR